MRKGQKHSEKSKKLISQSKKQPGYVTTFQGRKSDDNRWLREGKRFKLPPVPEKDKEFWDIYESIRQQNPDMKFKNREWWFKWLEGDKIYKNFSKTLFLLGGQDDYDYISEFEDPDDFWACYRMYRELHGDEYEEGTRPWIWWYGGINNFWKKRKDGTFEDLPIPKDQENWLRKHKLLSQKEKYVLKQKKECA
jgi:hypothetical protein